MPVGVKSAIHTNNSVGPSRSVIGRSRMESCGVDRLIVLVAMGGIFVDAFLRAEVPDPDRTIMARGYHVKARGVKVDRAYGRRVRHLKRGGNGQVHSWTNLFGNQHTIVSTHEPEPMSNTFTCLAPYLRDLPSQLESTCID